MSLVQLLLFLGLITSPNDGLKQFDQAVIKELRPVVIEFYQEANKGNYNQELEVQALVFICELEGVTAPPDALPEDFPFRLPASFPVSSQK